LFHVKGLTETSKLDEAEKLFKKAMQIDPENTDLLVHLAMLYYKTRDEAAADEFVRLAVTKDPKCEFLLETIGEMTMTAAW
jgi:Tfp pilus assembly protein PilF